MPRNLEKVPASANTSGGIRGTVNLYIHSTNSASLHLPNGKLQAHNLKVVGFFLRGVVIEAVSLNVSIPICYNKALEILKNFSESNVIWAWVALKRLWVL